MRPYLLITILLFHCFTGSAQEPERWIFGKNGGLNFIDNQTTPATYEVENCYSATSSKCDANGNLLFYCDGRTIKDKDGNIMPGSENPVWPASPHVSMTIPSTIIPLANDTNRYYVFMFTPSDGNTPFGSYYQNAVTYSVVDMRLNNGAGGVDPVYSNVLLDTNSNGGFIVAKSKDCNYWLVVFKMGIYQQVQSHFAAFKITDAGIEPPVKSAVNITGFNTDGVSLLKMKYAPLHKKIIECYGPSVIASHDFNEENGIVTNGKTMLEMTEFKNNGGGVTFPSFALSANEKFLYLLGYPTQGTGPNGPSIILRQYPLDLSLPNPALSNSDIIFQSDDALYQTSVTPLPYISQNCDIALGQDNKIYMFYNAGMAFMGLINQPDNSGVACNFEPQGVQLLPNTFGSYFFPPPNNERVKVDWKYSKTDTSICLAAPITLNSNAPESAQYVFVWNDGVADRSKTISGEGVYWVKAIGDCSETQYLDIFIIRDETAEKCNCRLFVPSAFSPNDDLLNDIFKPMIANSCINGNYEFKIFNRWGQLVFQSNKSFIGWDGKTNEKLSDMGAYFYYASFEDFKGEIQKYKGDFLLIR